MPSLYHHWVEEGDRIQLELDDAKNERIVAKRKFEDAKRKVAQLPALIAKLSDIETELSKARRILPDDVEMDTILASVGMLANEYSVQLRRFELGMKFNLILRLNTKKLPSILKFVVDFRR